ncbi:hypothetical protein BD309DRAFT_239629 [Dichomitus squalens]|uniref:Uncharacterized protein n=1 Tax=Dichomitus squalens TaxID=114155 RepID=A0A4Q9Q2U9_9APHY|nr:hypothetical protein BD309DRAFT_239629 [Dichomitus squalens]TBU61321.1 hypothetical protein BD310DRAFT_219121 [Dichomitus squalens]
MIATTLVTVHAKLLHPPVDPGCGHNGPGFHTHVCNSPGKGPSTPDKQDQLPANPIREALLLMYLIVYAA